MKHTFFKKIIKLSQGNSLRISLVEFEGNVRLDVRIWFESRPTRLGWVLSPDKLPELIAALEAAREAWKERETWQETG